ncbi:O-methyltransferase asqD [Lachnellula suecica]|uniref:O-methyltransferase asqD n=1 Tax=Lachnellula suecica TaxID=602035 RepID=A0A8T9CG85_9HELO|nr:O-methyltransferase asqD [Lachnellula suecica]
MANEAIAAGHIMVWEVIVGAASKAPKFLKETGYRNPTKPRDGLMQYAFQTKLDIFGLLATMPDIQRAFDTFMGNTMGAREYWVDWYPVEERILTGAESNTPLIVDVGGGKGHDLVAFHEKYPGRGKLVLQELQPVIDNIKSLNSVAEPSWCSTHDFFTEQPIQGARVYFYHHILHDWPDEKCVEILKHAKKAMTPGYSKLLLHELILPEQGASVLQARFDLVMMAFNSGMERTGKQWRVLLEMAGFEVVKLWVPGDSDADGLVEAVVMEDASI